MQMAARFSWALSPKAFWGNTRKDDHEQRAAAASSSKDGLAHRTEESQSEEAILNISLGVSISSLPKGRDSRAFSRELS